MFYYTKSQFREKIRHFPMRNFRLVLLRNVIMLQHHIIQFLLYQVVTYRRVQPEEKSTVLALKMVMVAYKRWTLTTGSKYRNLTWKHLLFWKTDCWGEVVAYRKWSQLEVWLYSKACRLSNTNTIFNFSVGWVWIFSRTTLLTITLTVKKRLIVTVITTHRILKLKINIDMYIYSCS